MRASTYPSIAPTLANISTTKRVETSAWAKFLILEAMHECIVSKLLSNLVDVNRRIQQGAKSVCKSLLLETIRLNRRE